MKLVHFKVEGKPYHIDATEVDKVLDEWEIYAQRHVLTKHQYALMNELEDISIRVAKQEKYRKQSKAYAEQPTKQLKTLAVKVYDAKSKTQYSIEAIGNNDSFMNVIIGIVLLFITLRASSTKRVTKPMSIIKTVK
jgi:hypothetical protein